MEETNDPIKTALENIDKKLDDKLNENFKNLEAKLDSTNFKKHEEEVPSIFEEGDDDIPLTKKDLISFGEKILSAAEKRSQKVVNTTFENQQSRAFHDQNALMEFPELDQRSKDFNKGFFDEVVSEMEARKNRGRGDDPELLYDSAAKISNKWIQSGKKIPRHIVERERQAKNNQDDNFNVNGRQKNDPFKPNENQLRLASRMGLSKERLTQIFEKRRNF